MNKKVREIWKNFYFYNNDIQEIIKKFNDMNYDEVIVLGDQIWIKLEMNDDPFFLIRK
jgi:hypothetical protein